MPPVIPKIVCLDLGGVVVRICQTWAQACAAVKVTHHTTVDSSDDATRLLRTAVVDRYQRGLMPYDEFIQEIAAIFGGVYSAQEIGRIHDGWILGDYPGMAELLDELRRIGMRVACLSNTNESHWQQMQASSTAFGAIEHRYASHLMGLNKPNAAIYAAFETAMKCSADEIFFADDLIENIQAARVRGWQTLHIDHTGDPALQIATALAQYGVNVRPATITEPSPVMTHTLCQSDGPGGVIKLRPSDFLVDELPLYDASGDGEHLFLGIQKQGMAHEEMIRVVAEHFQVDPASIGTAGRKDRRAVTRQTISVNLPGKEPTSQLTHDRLVVLWSHRHINKLRMGHLAGNRFSIRVREVDPLKLPIVHRRLLQLLKVGVPNAFGEQRFGNRMDNHLLGAMVLREDWNGIVQHLTGTRHPVFPEHQRSARLACDAGEWSASLPLWGFDNHAERRMALAMSRGWTSSRAVKSLGGSTLRFWVNALQSAIFNRVLDARVAAKTLNRLTTGDIAYRHIGGACFLVDGSETDESLNSRAMQFEISPTGPLWGSKMLACGSTRATIEGDAAREFAVDPALFSTSSHPPTGERRPLRIALANASVDSGIDEFGGYIRAVFDLPPGAFATIVLRELFGSIRTQHGE